MAGVFFAVHESAECFRDGAYVVWFVKGCLAAVAFFLCNAVRRNVGTLAGVEVTEVVC